MSTVRAYYDGAAFVPIEPVVIQKGKIVSLSISQDESISPEIAAKLVSFRRITKSLKELNDTEPLPAEFDEILAERTNFSGELRL